MQTEDRKPEAGVKEPPLINLNPKPKDHLDLFNIHEDRGDEIELAMKKARRNLSKASGVTMSSDEIIRAMAGIGKTPEEVAFIMLMTGMRLNDMKDIQGKILGGLGDLLRGKRRNPLEDLLKKHSEDNFTDDLLRDIKNHFRNR